MDPYSTHAIAAAHSADLHREAEESRVAKLARESREDERPAREPARRPARTRRQSLVQ
jgi:hypothetical protein